MLFAQRASKPLTLIEKVELQRIGASSVLKTQYEKLRRNLSKHLFPGGTCGAALGRLGVSNVNMGANLKCKLRFIYF